MLKNDEGHVNSRVKVTLKRVNRSVKEFVNSSVKMGWLMVALT